MTHCPALRQTGVTLAEMMVVIAVLGLVAALALPQASSVAPAAADAAAAEIASAIRFAQREAIRTRTFQQVSVDPVSQELRVYRTNASTGVTATHPVDKRDYKISFAGNAMPRATIVSSVFKYGTSTTNSASFGVDGAPAVVDPNKLTQVLSQLATGGPDIDPLKEEGRITIRYGNTERVVRVTPVTGRVAF